MRKITTKCILVILSLLVVYQSAIAKNDNNRQKTACSLEGFSADSDESVELEKKSFDSTKYSTEGAHIDAYFDDNSLKKVEVFIYGETSKTQIAYVFNSPQDYVVYDTRYHYSSPIYVKNSQVMATSGTKYLVCDGKPQKVVDQGDIQKKVDNAEQFLKDILKQLNEIN